VDIIRKHHRASLGCLHRTQKCSSAAASASAAAAAAAVTQIGGYWSSGLPYLDASYKATRRPWEAGLQLPLMMLNISDLQVRFLER
jgi:hypothetical protein